MEADGYFGRIPHVGLIGFELNRSRFTAVHSSRVDHAGQ